MEATRSARPSLPALVAVLLALIAGLSAPPLVVEQAGHATTASAEAAWHSDATAPADAVATEPSAVPVEAVERTPGVKGSERALRTRLVTVVWAARAPPLASA